ncbi:EI24 domain-containing protein [Lampropedia aestuarii]|uniref:EI24 domain-containing protein n=1 Tax=Lampropedia aestuarii TaxID=2562762 RepID=UPI0024683716|nr:EI24 domain-containing protein [Lampropedia aestuarii]MDH5856011.1 EI24 domain-containing protein [Lampropedia aestuarii]
MQLIMESFWRALLDSFRPKIIGLSFLPLLLIVVAALVLGYFYWGAAVMTVTDWMHASVIWTWVDGRLSELGAQNVTAIFAPLLVVLLVSPILVILSLLLVTMLMTPAMAKQVATKRFPGLKPQAGSTFWRSLGWSLSSTVMALLALVVTLPLWLIPPMALILPPLIWGWLAYRVMSFDALVEYTSSAERKAILEQHRWPLLVIGIICGFLGAMPSIVWASGLIFALAFFVLIPAAVWLFTWVFALTSLWYAHYCLAVVAERRGAQALVAEPEVPSAPASGVAPVADAVASPAAATSSSSSDEVASAAKASVVAVEVVDAVQAVDEKSVVKSSSQRLIATDVPVDTPAPDAGTNTSQDASSHSAADASSTGPTTSSSDSPSPRE